MFSITNLFRRGSVTMQGANFPSSTGDDPVSKFRGGEAISVIFGCSLITGSLLEER